MFTSSVPDSSARRRLIACPSITSSSHHRIHSNFYEGVKNIGFIMINLLSRCTLFWLLYLRVSSFAPTPLFSRFPTRLSSDLADRLGLGERFDRWRFLQNLLELEVENDTINEILYQLLGNALERKKSGTNDEEALEITLDLEEKMEQVLSAASDDLTALDSIDLLNQISPDPQEDEDAHKSSWDTVMEITGRENVKLNESNPTPEWTLYCLKARLLIHFDFLTIGI